MLNTPRSTWGVQDLAKSRALLALIKGLEGPNFKIIFQPRAGLDYFKPDLYEARIQLAAVTALMDDIEPHDESSPPIIHVVSYSEAVHLATPEIIDDSIRITLFSLQEYRRLRKERKVEDMAMNSAVSHRMQELLDSARIMINGLEKHIPNLYTPEGFYLTFVAGFLPTPYLWDENEEYRFAKHWKTKLFRGGTFVVDKELNPVKAEEVLNYGLGNLSEAQYALKKKRS